MDVACRSIVEFEEEFDRVAVFVIDSKISQSVVASARGIIVEVRDAQQPGFAVEGGQHICIVMRHISVDID